MYLKIVITGIGVVCPCGIGTQISWEFLLKGKSAVGHITHFDSSDYRSKIGAEIKNWQPEAFMDHALAKRIDKAEQFSVAAASLAIQNSGLELARLECDRVGVCVGSGLGGVYFAETQLTELINYGPKRVHPLTVPNVNPNAVATFIAMNWNLFGPNLTVATACASGAHAIGQALMFLRMGKADVILAGGAENPIMPMTFAGFDAMRVMSCTNDTPEKASRPFDLNRNGFVIGEGAGILVLETEAHAKKRGARIYAELAGYGANNGGYHIVAPRPDGSDAAKAMELALADAQLSKDKVGYINAHGTSTKANDSSETQAIKTVFGQAPIPVSSTKGATGHMIGAAGAVEAGVTALALFHQMLPPTANYEVPDPECDLDVIAHARASQLKGALSNSFGFGNNNACLVFKQYE